MQKKLADAKRKGLGTAVLETTLADQLKLEGVDEGQAVDVAVMLQPLLEQENQLEYVDELQAMREDRLTTRTMIADANAQRKYEDSKALTAALEDIRQEIGRVTSQAIS